MICCFQKRRSCELVEHCDTELALRKGPVSLGVEVDKYTRGYLEYLRGKVQEILDEGGTLSDAYESDQSPYMHLETADELAGKNAGRIFEAMEWE